MSKACTLLISGGEGRRIGGHKADIKLCGTRLIDHVLSRSYEWDLPVYLQVRRADQINAPGLTQILDDPNIEGPLSGLIAGLRFAKEHKFSHVLSIGCDMPFLPSNLLDWLWPAARKSQKIIVASSDGQLHPICAMWPVACLTSLERYAANGELSLKRASQTFGREVLDWSTMPYDPFFNINTLQDLAHAQIIMETVDAKKSAKCVLSSLSTETIACVSTDRWPRRYSNLADLCQIYQTAKTL